MIFFSMLTKNKNKLHPNENEVTDFEVIIPTLSRKVIIKDKKDLRKFMSEQIKKRDEILKKISKVNYDI